MKLLKIYNTKKRGELRACIEIDGKKFTIQVGKKSTILTMGNGMTYYFTGIYKDNSYITYRKFFGQWENVHEAENTLLSMNKIESFNFRNMK
jgi:hypothetical protein